MESSKKNEHTNRKPKVSVIVATYRRNKELEKALNSLLSQTYKNTEIVIVDDNADSEWNIIVESIINKVRVLSNFPIKYVKNTINKGSANTRNIGIENTTGKIITFLDDDDVYLPDKIKNQLEKFLDDKADFSITDLDLYNEKDILIEKRKRTYLTKNNLNLLKSHLKYHMTGTDTLMFTREYLNKIGGFSSINYGDEFHLMEKAILGKGKLSYLAQSDIKAYVHSHTKGLSSGESQIRGEKALYKHKKDYFHLLDKNDIKYIKVRHFAVLAYTELRRKKLFKFLQYCFQAFLISPKNSVKLYYSRKI